jgi:ABC-type transport system involved in cytochrome bd biosynthesis fused ATPase/permease subunit
MPIIEQKITNYRENVLKQVKILFREESYEMYSNMSFNDKSKTTIQEFDRLVDSATYAIEDELMSKISSFVSLSSILSSCFLMFKKHNAIHILLCLSILSITTYKLIISKQHALINKRNEDNHLKMEKIICIRSLFLSLFQTKQLTYSKLIELDIQEINMYNNYRSDRQKMQNQVTFMNIIGLIIIFYITYNNISRFILLFIIYDQYNNAISVFFNYLETSEIYQPSYLAYENYFKNCIFTSEYEKLPLPLYFEITDLLVNVNGIQLKFNDDITSLKLYSNEKYLIRGPSGHGKTTFINSLLGKFDGLKYKYNKAENYFHHYSEMHQNIKEYLPTSKVTIRQLFNDEFNDKIIIEFLTLCEISDWINEIKEFDVFIENRISGGQKTRLAIARQAYILWKEKKSILILDEPEQGSDPEIAYKIINNIMNKFPEKMIIVISHLELIDTKFKWDNKFKIFKNNGICTFFIDK